MSTAASPDLSATRASWHRVAEHVLAAGQFAAAGTIRLRPSPGGFATAVGVDGRRLAVEGGDLVVHEGADRHATPLTTLGAVAEFAGVTPGLRGSYSPATPADRDAPLRVDAGAARLLAGWFALGDVALRRFADGLGRPQEPVLWPEHFDLGITLDAVDYGCSPGDDAIGEPYLYVGPHAGPPADDPFWNAPFGAAVTADAVHDADEAVAFFVRGRALTGGRRA
jgi:hypothetical protein